jgi:hypothetical protein
VHAVRLRACLASAPVTERNTLRVPRPDVLEALGPDRAELDCGFMAYCALPGGGAELMHLEVETARGEVGYKPLPAPRGGGSRRSSGCCRPSTCATTSSRPPSRGSPDPRSAR